jgi:hypothetical protein
MEEQQVSEAKQARQSNHRPYRFYAVVTHRQRDTDGNIPDPQVLEFDSKAQLRAELEKPQYELCQARVIRGYELTVSKRGISIN